MNTSQQCSHTGFWVAIILLILFLFISMIANIGFFIGMAVFSKDLHFGSYARDEFPRLEEIWSYGRGTVKAARIPVNGVITRKMDAGFFNIGDVDRVETVLRQIRMARNDYRVKAIILEVNSPGGEITPTDEIYHALSDFKQSDKGRKVIVFVRDLAASGGYYISMASDWIIAEPTAVIGSIAAIIQTLNWKELSDKIGIHDITIKAGRNKDLLNPFRDVSPEQLEIFQKVVHSMYNRFIQVVLEGRAMDPEVLQELADGRILTANQALYYNLIDQQGYWDDVVAKTAEFLGEASIKIVRYEEKPGFSRLFSQIRSPVSLSRLIDLASPRFMYLWRP